MKFFRIFSIALMGGLLVAQASIAAEKQKSPTAVSIQGFDRGQAVSIYNNLSLPYTHEADTDDIPFLCGSRLTDRDGFSYNTIALGGKCWMAENLKTRTREDGSILTTGSDTSERDCMTTSNSRGTEKDCIAGRTIYSLGGAMDEDPASPRGICPRGWRLPKDSDFYVLESSLSAGRCNPERSSREGATVTGCRLNGPLNDCAPAGNTLKGAAVSKTRFNWTLGGLRFFDENTYETSFMKAGEEGFLWSHDIRFNYCGWNMSAPQYAIYRSVHREMAGVTRDKLFAGNVLMPGMTAMPVRCVRDL